MLALLILLCAATLAPAKQLGWQKLFDGHDLQRLEARRARCSFTVEHGLLKTQGGMGLLYWAGGPFSDCEIKVVYRMEHENDNSGVFIRIPSRTYGTLDAGQPRIRGANRQPPGAGRRG
jgi:hypothetical protein